MNWELEHAQRYWRDTVNDSFMLPGSNKVSHFTAPASEKKPKLYVISRQGIPVPGYVGITSQSMATRLRQGFQADGKHGYHGYRWKNERELTLDIWRLTGVPSKCAPDVLECVEAEVVFLARKTYKQWPEFQTEIHFHESKPFHRHAAERIIQHLKRHA